MHDDTEVESEPRPERGLRKVQAADCGKGNPEQEDGSWLDEWMEEEGIKSEKATRGGPPWVAQLAFLPVPGMPPADCDIAAGPVPQAPVS